MMLQSTACSLRGKSYRQMLIRRSALVPARTLIDGVLGQTKGLLQLAFGKFFVQRLNDAFDEDLKKLDAKVR